MSQWWNIYDLHTNHATQLAIEMPQYNRYKVDHICTSRLIKVQLVMENTIKDWLPARWAECSADWTEIGGGKANESTAFATYQNNAISTIAMQFFFYSFCKYHSLKYNRTMGIHKIHNMIDKIIEFMHWRCRFAC